MTIETHLNHVLDSCLSLSTNSPPSVEALIHTIDLTLLKEDPDELELNQIRDLAQVHPVAAVCMHTPHFSHFKIKEGINKTTVVNFPKGQDSVEQCIKQIDEALAAQVTEIDYVFPYLTYLAGKEKKAMDHAQVVAQYCKQKKCLLKIILETGAFTSMQSIYQLGLELIPLGCNFLKTSTGKIPQGASLSAVLALLSAIKDSKAECGIKISGGVKDPLQAEQFATISELIMGKKIDKGWFRIGASGLLGRLSSLPPD